MDDNLAFYKLDIEKHSFFNTLLKLILRCRNELIVKTIKFGVQLSAPIAMLRHSIVSDLLQTLTHIALSSIRVTEHAR